ncbi:MAG: hypothetical protein P8L24_05150 [Cytophagales bacterium]|nr:hypothetical protein [Cytophagales bacterium]
MKRLFTIVIFLFSYSFGYCQILPAQHGVHYKKEGGSCSSSESLMGLSNQSTTYGGTVRGYYFTAPTDFCISAVKVPTTGSSGCQSVEIVKFNSGPPPAFPSTTNDFTQLHYTSCLDNTDKITVDISVIQGDVIGIYGCRGTNCVNSYGEVFTTAIAGNSVELFRSGMQFNLVSNQMKEI